jgi:small subunit ribosomal protein S6
MYILKSDLGEEQTTASIERFNEMVVRASGTVDKTDKWGRRKLAFDIDGHSEGFYVLVTFQGDGTIANEVSRQLKIQEDVLRSMIVRLDA